MTLLKIKSIDGKEVIVHDAEVGEYGDLVVFLGVGTTDPEDGSWHGSGIDLSPKEARRIANALLKAAKELKE